mgnify:CR=1 FL=1
MVMMVVVVMTVVLMMIIVVMKIYVPEIVSILKGTPTCVNIPGQKIP